MDPIRDYKEKIQEIFRIPTAEELVTYLYSFDPSCRGIMHGLFDESRIAMDKLVLRKEEALMALVKHYVTDSYLQHIKAYDKELSKTTKLIALKASNEEAYVLATKLLKDALDSSIIIVPYDATKEDMQR